MPGPALVSQATVEAAQVRRPRHPPWARRPQTAQDALRRGLVRCGPGPWAWTGRARQPGADDASCRGRPPAWRAAPGARGPARDAPAGVLETGGWQALGPIRRTPAGVPHARPRAPGGAWLPQAFAPLDRPPARRLAVARADRIGRDACARPPQEVPPTPPGLTPPRRPVAAQAPPQGKVASLAQGSATFCHRLGPTWETLTVPPRRPLGERLLARGIVTAGPGDIRAVVPTGPQGETTPFGHVR